MAQGSAATDAYTFNGLVNVCVALNGNEKPMRPETETRNHDAARKIG